MSIIEKMEGQKITAGAWLFTFFAIFFLRIFLETLSSGLDYFDSSKDLTGFVFFHLPAFFLLGALFFILVLHFLTKEKIEKITKVALFAFIIILLPPIIDLIVTGGRGGILMQYAPLLAVPGGIANFFHWFFEFFLYDCQGLLFFGKAPEYATPEIFNINYGVRIQLGLIFLGFIWYVFLKTKSILRVFLGLVILYLTTFVFYYFPLRLYSASASSLNPSFNHQYIIAALYIIAVCLSALIWFFIYNREKFISILKNLRPSRIAHNIILLSLGLYLGGVLSFDLNFGDKTLIALALVSLFLCLLGETTYDDLSDEKIDKISNPARPLPAGRLTRSEFQTLGTLFFIGSYLTAFIVGYAFFIFLLLRGFVSYIYGYPPFRLKRFPILATFIRALAFVFTIYAAFLLIAENSVFDFPGRLAIFALLAFTLGATVKDIRDYEGDRASDIYTIPVIFGLKKGKKILGLFVFIAFLSAPLIFSEHFKVLILPALLAGTLSFWLIGKEKYFPRTAPCLFLIYLIFGLFFILTIFKYY